MLVLDSPRPAARHLVLVALAIAMLCLMLLPARAAAVPDPDDGEVWFGPRLDWGVELARDYSDRLGSTPSLYAQRVQYPLDEESTGFLRQFARQASTQGSVAVVSLEPDGTPLGSLSGQDATDLAAELDDLHDELGVLFLVDFAPEMNGSWVTWGQQPTAYVDAFRTVAQALARTEVGDDRDAAMLWSPSYGTGYPFGGAYGAIDPAGETATDELDTDGDGVVTDADDPYGPYYPGADVVDWVGLSLYWFGPEGAFGTNQPPSADVLAASLDEDHGYTTRKQRRSFLDRFSNDDEVPFLLSTGALFNTTAPGDELAVKQAWWRQVVEAADRGDLEAVVWLELQRVEAEADGDLVDWRATDDDTMARALREDLLAGPVRLEPVTRVLDQETSNEAIPQAYGGEGYLGRDAGYSLIGWLAVTVGAMAAVYLLAGAARRWRPQWAYQEGQDRDHRLDLFRGIIIAAVVITHVEVAGPYSYVVVNAFGAVSGAEMFVLLSGVALGMAYAPLVRRVGELDAAVSMWKRARQQYVTAIVVVALVYLLGYLPLLDAGVLTTFTDRGTGSAGGEVTGTVYDLYPNAQRLLDYPPPGYAVRQFLLLQMGPWVFNIMGLFVVLSLSVPAMMWLVRRGWWWALLAISWALYVWSQLGAPDLVPSQFDDVFPLLTWQVCFTHGLVLGHHRARVVAALGSLPGRVLVGVLLAAYALLLVWAWVSGVDDPVTPAMPDALLGWLTDEAYRRVTLEPGRLVDLAVVLVVFYAAITAFWAPLDRWTGRFFTPLGAASLYVFVMHVLVVLAVGNIPGLDRTSWWQGALVHTASLALVWYLVRRRFLFSVVPQ